MLHMHKGEGHREGDYAIPGAIHGNEMINVLYMELNDSSLSNRRGGCPHI